MVELFIILLCLLFNAVLASAEMAFVTVRRPQLRRLIESGNTGAKKLLILRERPERTLSVIQIGITLVGAIGAAVGGAGAEESLSPILQDSFVLTENSAEIIAVLLVVLPLTYFNVVLGELVPKALALRDPIGIALKSASPLYFCDRLLTPIVSFLDWSTKKVLSQVFKRSYRSNRSEQETEPSEISDLSSHAQEYFLNFVSLEKKRVQDAMLLWDQVISLDSNDTIENIEATIVSSGHTRLPVMSDKSVLGIINAKEFMALRNSGMTEWKSILRPAVTVLESTSLISALRLMQERRSHLSIVYSQNSRVGIVTMEDILEEVIGDVFDEDDDGAIRKILSLGSQIRTQKI